MDCHSWKHGAVERVSKVHIILQGDTMFDLRNQCGKAWCVGILAPRRQSQVNPTNSWQVSLDMKHSEHVENERSCLKK